MPAGHTHGNVPRQKQRLDLGLPTGSRRSGYPDGQPHFRDVLERVKGNRRDHLSLEGQGPISDWRSVSPQAVLPEWRQGSTMALLLRPGGASGATSFLKKAPGVAWAG